MASEAEAESFFQPASRPFTTSILREYLEFCVDGREGANIPGSNGSISESTVRGILHTLSSLASRFRNPIDPHILRSAHDWIDGRLIPQGRVNLVSRRKKLTTPQDVSLLLRTLFSVTHMATFPRTREILHVALFLNLAVDCSGRISEILLHGGRLCEGKCLRWQDVEIYAFRSAEETISLQASVRYSGLKGVSAHKEKRSKVIPLRLLPIHLAAEDTLRQLITLGIIDDVFPDVKSWEDVQFLLPGPHGSRVAVKETSLSLPVSNSKLL